MGVVQIGDKYYWENLEYGKEYFLGYGDGDHHEIKAYYFGINQGHFIFYNDRLTGEFSDRANYTINGFSSSILEPVRWYGDIEDEPNYPGFYFESMPKLRFDLERKIIKETIIRMRSRGIE